MDYYNEIDPIGEERDECRNCKAPTNFGEVYCSNYCKKECNE
jgi:hypothetical protein